MTVDHIEAGRVAHELRLRHGRNAYQYAAKVAAEALVKGHSEEHEFWKCIEAALKPRANQKS
jgi:hypothetical protein